MAAIPVLLTFLLSDVFAADGTTTKVWKDYVKNGPVVGNLPDFHTAGCAPERLGAEKGKTFNVTDYGANPKDRENDRDAIQRAIDTAGAAGGGIVYFPEGRYYIPGGNESNIIQVRHSNIILRGPGLDSKGRQQAILFLQRVSQGKKGGLVGRDEPDHRENGCIMIKGENSGKMVATLASDGKRGDTVITVDSTKALSQGQIISIKAEDSIDLENPRLEDIDLIAELNEPRALTEKDDKTWNNIHTKIIYSIYRVKRIISATELELSRPLRFNHKLSYKARIESFPGALTGVGVEDLGIETDWPGQFVHHKPYPYWYGKKAEGALRPAKEQDYEWVGIWASWAVDCWIKNVSIRDTTQGLVMANAHHFTVENVSLYGAEGHAGITMTMSGDSLFRDLYFVQRSCHPISLRSWCSGNVFTKCTAHFSKRDHLSATGPHVDFHGMFPYEAAEAIADEVVRIVRAFVETGKPPNTVNMCARSPATHSLVVRHYNRVGVLAGVLDLLREEEINVEEMENTVFDNARAACCTLQLDSAPSDSTVVAILSDESILQVALSSR